MLEELFNGILVAVASICVFLFFWKKFFILFTLFYEFFVGLLKGDKVSWCNMIGFAMMALIGCCIWGWMQVRGGLLVDAAKFAAPVGAAGLLGLVAWIKPVHDKQDEANTQVPTGTARLLALFALLNLIGHNQDD